VTNETVQHLRRAGGKTQAAVWRCRREEVSAYRSRTAHAASIRLLRREEGDGGFYGALSRHISVTKEMAAIIWRQKRKIGEKRKQQAWQLIEKAATAAAGGRRKAKPA